MLVVGVIMRLLRLLRLLLLLLLTAVVRVPCPVEAAARPWSRETLRAKSPADIAGGRMLVRGPNLRPGDRAGATRGPGLRAVYH